MPIAEIESVVAVSSEDPLHPARNLLSSAIGNNVKKWICEKKGERNVSVIFKLKEKANITNIIVGNENTSIIEILVLNTESKENECQVLLPTTEIQTVQDVRKGTNKNSVHFFSTKDFKSDVAGRLWERIKVVCNQPYDSHIRFGLSCFVVKSIKNEIDDNTEACLDESKNEENEAVNLPEEDKQQLNAWKENMLQRLTPIIRKNRWLLEEEIIRCRIYNAWQKLMSAESRHTSGTSILAAVKVEPNLSPKRIKQEHDSSNESTTPIKIKKELKKERPESSSHNGISQAGSSKQAKKPMEVKPMPPKREFNKIMDGVKISMSGYENPLRSELRNKALEMGSKYSADWNSSCTHLICAFLNTPKFNQVMAGGNGKVVIKDWIEECYRKRKRLPWRRFALDKNERKFPISEEDEDAEDEKTSQQSTKKDVDRRRRLPSPSSSDTEDEIERVRARIAAKKPKRDTAVTKKQDVNDLYNADTEDDDDIMDDSDELFDDTDVDADYSPDNSGSESSAFSDVQSSLESSNVFSDSEHSTPRSKRRKQDKKKMKKKKKNQVSDKSPRKVKNFGRRPDTSDVPLPPLPDAPASNYFIAIDESGHYRDQLERYIHAFNGCVYEDLSAEVEFAITDDVDVAKQIVAKFPNIKAVKSEWIWRCSDEDELISPEDFLLV